MKEFAKKIIINYHHSQDKLHFFSCRIIEEYDVATQITKTAVGVTKELAAQTLVNYFLSKYFIEKTNIVLNLIAKPSKPND